MLAMDQFTVVELIRGQLKATVIDVRPQTPKSTGYPKGLRDGKLLALRLSLSDESCKQAEENERHGIRALIIDGEEVEEIDMP